MILSWCRRFRTVVDGLRRVVRSPISRLAVPAIPTFPVVGGVIAREPGPVKVLWAVVTVVVALAVVVLMVPAVIGIVPAEIRLWTLKQLVLREKKNGAVADVVQLCAINCLSDRPLKL